MSTKELILIFAQPTSNGVVGADVPMKAIQEQILNLDMGATGRAIMVDETDTVMIAVDDNLIGEKLPSLIEGGTLGSSVSHLKFNDTDVFAVHLPITNTSWSVLVTLDSLEALSDFTFKNIIATAVIIVAFMSLTIRILLRPLNKVTNAMKYISMGDASLTQRLSVQSSDDIGKLSTYFNNFIKSIHIIVIDVVDSTGQLIELSNQSKDVAGANNNSIQNSSRKFHRSPLQFMKWPQPHKPLLITPKSPQKQPNRRKQKVKTANSSP